MSIGSKDFFVLDTVMTGRSRKQMQIVLLNLTLSL